MSLVLGIGGRPGADADALAALVETALADEGLAPEQVSMVATLDRRAGEGGIRSVAARLGATVAAYSAQTLAAQEVPNPSSLVRRHTGSAAVAEAAVLASGAQLVSPKRGATSWTVAIGRMPTAEEAG